jgi:hypothetical protein
MTLDHSSQVQRRTYAERGLDLYGTPPVAVETLLRIERIPTTRTIWEPCAGRGNIAETLRGAGYTVICSDVQEYGFALDFTADFLTLTKAPDGVEDNITNPPYQHATRCVAKSLDLVPRTWMLMRLAYLEAGDIHSKQLTRRLRSQVLDSGTLARVHVFRRRLPMMHRDGWSGRESNSGMAFRWFCWDASHSGPATVDRISWDKTS